MNEYTPLLITENDIEEREDAIIHIQEEMFEVNEIFKMLAQLSHEQGYLIDHIGENIDDVVVNVERADEELESANKKQAKRNKILWYILFILLFILLVITLVILLTLKK